MTPEQKDFLNLRDKPARMNYEEAAFYLGFRSHDVPILVARGLLKPLSVSLQSATKYFAKADLDRFRIDTRWLARATAAVQQFWKAKNLRKLESPGSSETNGSSFDE